LSKVVICHNHNLVDKTLDRDISTFRNHYPAFGTSDFSPDEPSYFGDACHQRADYDAGTVALERERRQLSKLPTFISQRTSVESDPVVVFSAVLFEASRRVYCGR
jgi:hypothetical protein